MEFHQPNNIYKQDLDIDDNALIEEYYTLLGEEDFIKDNKSMRNHDDSKVYAKRIQRKDGSFKNLIRLTSNSKLYNPLSIYGQEKANAFLDRTCKSNNKFKTVNDKAFNWYLQFLSTKNISWLYNAEREVE